MVGLSSAFGLLKPCIPVKATHRHASSAALECDLSSHRARLHVPSDHAARLRVATHASAVDSSGTGSTRRVATHAAAVESSPAVISPRPKPYLEVLPAPAPSRMVNDNRAWVEEHRIRGYEVGPDQHTTMQSIANIIQEVASNHAVAMWGRSEEGFATDPDLAEKGLIFVMTRLQVQMDDYPKWGDVVKVETWFQASGKIGAQRDFLFTCAQTGKQLGRATSSWVMINLRTRRVAKMPDSVREKCFWYAEEAPARQAIAPIYTKHKIHEVDMPAELVAPNQWARRSDIDMNGHVNNVTYMAWALETVPEDIYHKCHLYQVEIDFKAECHCGDEIESLAQRSSPPEALASNGAGPQSLAFVHTLRRCEGSSCTELVRMRTVWRAGEAPCQ